MMHNTYLRSKKARIAFILVLTFLVQIIVSTMQVEAVVNYYTIDRWLNNPWLKQTVIFYKDCTVTNEGDWNIQLYIDEQIYGNSGKTITVPYDVVFSHVLENKNPMRVYTIKAYKISFDSNGGNENYESLKGLIRRYDKYETMVNYGADAYENSYRLAIPTPTRDGYTFEGWYTEANGGTQVTNDTVFTETSDITLYAHWSRYSSYTVNDNLTYNGTEQTGITFDSETVTCEGTYKATNAGTYTATLTPKDGYTWSDGSAGSKEVTWTISPGTIPDETIKFEDNEVTYDGKEHSITVTGELSGGTVEYSLDNTSWSSTLPKFTDAGVYPIHYKASKTNYEKSGTATLTINKKAITPEITIDKTEFTYNGSVQQPVVSVKLDNANIPAAEFNAVYTSDSTNVGNNKSVTVSSSNHN